MVLEKRGTKKESTERTLDKEDSGKNEEAGEEEDSPSAEAGRLIKYYLSQQKAEDKSSASLSNLFMFEVLLVVFIIHHIVVLDMVMSSKQL